MDIIFILDYHQHTLLHHSPNALNFEAEKPVKERILTIDFIGVE
jgi:hypothetical protein